MSTTAKLSEEVRRLSALAADLRTERDAARQSLSESVSTEAAWMEKVAVARNERDAANDWGADGWTLVNLIADALKVPYEPHQTVKERLLETAERVGAEGVYAGSCRRALCQIASLGESSMSDTEAIQAAMDIAVTALAKNPVNAEPSASTQSAGTTESALNPGPHSEALRDAARRNLDLRYKLASVDHDAVTYAAVLHDVAMSDADLERVLSQTRTEIVRPQVTQAPGVRRDGTIVSGQEEPEAVKGRQESDGEEVRSLPVGGVQLAQTGSDVGGMPLSVGRSRPDKTATSFLGAVPCAERNNNCVRQECRERDTCMAREERERVLADDDYHGAYAAAPQTSPAVGTVQPLKPNDTDGPLYRVIRAVSASRVMFPQRDSFAAPAPFDLKVADLEAVIERMVSWWDAAQTIPSQYSVRAAAERMVQTYRDWMAGCANETRWKEVEAAHINLRDALAKPPQTIPAQGPIRSEGPEA